MVIHPFRGGQYHVISPPQYHDNSPPCFRVEVNLTPVYPASKSLSFDKEEGIGVQEAGSHERDYGDDFSVAPGCGF